MTRPADGAAATVDLHAHFLPPELADEAPFALKATVHEYCDLLGVLETVEAKGVDRVVLSPQVTLCAELFAGAEAERLMKVQNEALAAAAREHPSKVSALGTVRAGSPEFAADDLAALMRLPGFVGVEVNAAVDGCLLGADRFRPFWEAAEDTGALVLVHPTQRGFGLAEMREFHLANSVGNPTETALCAAHLVFAGVMAAHPRLKVLLSHGGGSLPALRGRLRKAASIVEDVEPSAVDAGLAQFYFDSVTHDPEILRQLVDWVGPDRVVLGSDYPFDMGVDDPVALVRDAGFPADVEAGILGGNANRLTANATG